MAAYKPIRIGDSVPLQQINPSTETIDGLIQVTQTGVVLGRSSTGAGGHEEILFADLPGGGGASYTEITYADMATALAGSTLTPGGWYLITDAAGTDLGFLTYAVKENEISPAGVGGYLNADFQAIGDYSGVEAITGQAAGTQQGIWQAANEGGYLQGDILIWNLLHWQLTDSGAIDGTDPATNVAAYTQLLKTDAGQGYVTAWDVSEFDFLDNRIEFRSDVQNNVVYGNSISGFQFGNNNTYNNILYSGNIDIKNIIAGFDGNVFFPGSTFQRVNTGSGSAIEGNMFEASAAVSDINAGGVFQFVSCHLYPNSTISNLNFGDGCYLQDNILENSASLTGITAGANCSISRNKIGQGATLGGTTTMGDGAAINDNILESSAQITQNTLGINSRIYGIYVSSNSIFGVNILNEGANIQTISIGKNVEIAGNTFGFQVQFSTCTFFPLSGMSNCSLSDNTVIENNILENGASLNGITAGENCSISRNKIGQGATLGGTTTMGDWAAFNDLDIRANKQISNKALDAAVTFSDKIIQLTTDAAETYSANVEGNRVQPGYSDIPATLDITGLTTLDCTVEWAQYRGIYNLTSTNATEAIDTITNPPTSFPFTLRPAAGLVLTVTGTAYAGIAAGQIALKAASYALDGDKGEYIVLEIDPLGTGALIEKAVINGLI